MKLKGQLTFPCDSSVCWVICDCLKWGFTRANSITHWMNTLRDNPESVWTNKYMLELWLITGGILQGLGAVPQGMMGGLWLTPCLVCQRQAASLGEHLCFLFCFCLHRSQRGNCSTSTHAEHTASPLSSSGSHLWSGRWASCKHPTLKLLLAALCSFFLGFLSQWPAWRVCYWYPESCHPCSQLPVWLWSRS